MLTRYRRDTYLRSCSFAMQLVRRKKFWPRTEDELLGPPEEKAMPGKPKRNKKKVRINPKTMVSFQGKTVQKLVQIVVKLAIIRRVASNHQ